MRRFDGKVALVTGAASGIGRASAIRLAEEGASVLCADRNRQGADETAASLAGEAGGWTLDVSDTASCEAAVAEAVRRWGKLDILCNIAGVGSFGHAADTSDAEWQRVLAVNLTGVFAMSRAALPHLIETRGNIVNIASAAGLVGTPYALAYATSKTGVVGLTKSLAVEYASRGVRVNAICPGGVDTPLVAGGFDAIDGLESRLFERLTALMGNGGLVQPEEIAGPVAFLASDDARFVTGAILPVDGGQTAA